MRAVPVVCCADHQGAHTHLWPGSDETSSVDDLWRFVQFYGPLWVAMGYNTWVYYKARQMIQRMLRLKARGAAQKKRVPLLLYPAVLLVCWAFGTINRLQNWVRRPHTHTYMTATACVCSTDAHALQMSPDHPLEWLFAAQVVTSNLQGLLHALAYSQTASVRAQLKARLCGGRDGASHSGSSKLPGTGDESDSDGESGAHGASSGHVELLSMQSGPAGASPADAAAPVTRPRRASLIDVDMEQLSDVSHQVRTDNPPRKVACPDAGVVPSPCPDSVHVLRLHWHLLPHGRRCRAPGVCACCGCRR